MKEHFKCQFVFLFKVVPHQMNGSDCGMFACKYADYITREIPISFTQVSYPPLQYLNIFTPNYNEGSNIFCFVSFQADMPQFRRLMVYEILKKKLLT